MRNKEFENEEFNEEFMARKTDEKNEKMRDQKSSILEAYLEENFLNSVNLVKNCQIRMQ